MQHDKTCKTTVKWFTVQSSQTFYNEEYKTDKARNFRRWLLKIHKKMYPSIRGDQNKCVIMASVYHM